MRCSCINEIAGVAFWPQIRRCMALLVPEHIFDLALLLVYSWLYSLIPTNTKKPASHSLVDGKGIKSQIEVLAILGYKANVSEEYAGNVIA